MYSSTHYHNEVNKYTNIKNKLQGTITYFDNVIDKLNTSNMFFFEQEKMIMVGEQLDEGKVGESLQSVKEAKRNIETIMGECDQMIERNNDLYQQAISQELDERDGMESNV